MGYIARGICKMFGHKFHMMAAWLTGKPNSMRKCMRCGLVQTTIISLDGTKRIVGSEWRDVGRSVMI